GIIKRGIMNRNFNQARQPFVSDLVVVRGMTFLALLVYFASLSLGQAITEPGSATPSSFKHVKHVLGFEGAKRNAAGELRISGEALQFQHDGSVAAQVSISSIQNISLGQEDNQVGGVPITLGKAAVPYGGGRVVSLFAHKKYDTFTVEYLD